MRIKEILIKKYGKVPDSLDGVFSDFEDGRMMFFNGLDYALKNRKKTPFERYVDIARIVFGFFEQMYVYQRELTSKDKVSILLGKKFNEVFWKDFLKEFLKNANVSYKSCSCKAEKDIFFEEYEKIFSMCPEIKDFVCVSHHFMVKIQKKIHPFMTGYLIGFFEEEELEIKKLLLPFLLVESVIHGIDDYVDVSKRSKKEYTADILNIVLGLFALIFYLLDIMKIKISEIPRVLYTGKNKIGELVDSLFFSLVGLSQVPTIEKETIKILEYGRKAEMNTAIKNMKIRAAGINIFLVLSSHLLGRRNENDFMQLCNLIKDYRIIELLEKDLKDIKKDLKNKDYTPLAVWWKKYKKKGEFQNIVKSLAEIFYRDARTTSEQIREYPSVKSRFTAGIEEKFSNIIYTSKRIRD